MAKTIDVHTDAYLSEKKTLTTSVDKTLNEFKDSLLLITYEEN